MSNRSFRRATVARLAGAALACTVSFGCVSATAPTPKAAPPPPSKTQTQSDCQKQAQNGQPVSKDCAKTP
jgi:hypothetical protein